MGLAEKGARYFSYKVWITGPEIRLIIAEDSVAIHNCQSPRQVRF